MRPKFAFLIFCSVFFLASSILAPRALAHAPLVSGANESLDTASLIPDPAKSWAIYSELHEGGEAQYYRFDISQGQRIYVMLLKSTASEDEEFLPSFVLMGPELTSQGAPPSYVEVPEDYGRILVNGTQPLQANYEPFSPSSFHQLAEIDINAPTSGTFYVAVFEPSQGGHYGLAIGYIEEYSLDEWILLPLSLLSVYQWQRQSLAAILAPLFATLIVGLGLVIWRWKDQAIFRKPFFWTGSLAGLLFVGTGLMVLFQMVLSLMHAPLGPETVVTLILAFVPILLGLAAIRISSRTQASLRARIFIATIGVVALFLWAGLFVGPALAIASSIMPSAKSSELKK